MKVYRYETYEEMSAHAARLFAAQVTLKPDSVLGLATGSTPIGLYDELARKCAEGRVDFSAVRTVNLDEYYGLAPDHDQSYRYFMNKNLFDRINIDKANTNVPDGLAPDPDAECARYDALIASLGGVDMQLLGIGNNGHIGFNEPADHFVPGTNCVTLTQNTIEANSRFFASADEVPKKALTMGMYAIMNAKKVVVVINGAHKKDIMEAAISGPITPKVPASILQLHPDVTVLYSSR